MDQEPLKRDYEELPERWEETSRAFLQPLRAESSELFIQQVMRKVRAYGQNEEWIRWPVFTRWAFPALVLSIAGFTLSLAYTLGPAPVSTETLLLEGHDSGVLANWVSNPPSEDQILDSAVEAQ